MSHLHPTLSARSMLERGIDELGLTAPPDAVDRLLAYVGEIERWNPALGLVAEGERDLVARHLLDSLSAARIFAALPPGARILDLGSGAGLPGIPLAICLPRHRFVLVERSLRRSTFLEQCTALLRLSNVCVVARDVREYRVAVDAVTLRAVSPLTPRFLRSSGIVDRAPLLVAYKGTLVKARMEAQAAAPLYGSHEVVPVRVPFLDAQRHLVVLRR